MNKNNIVKSSNSASLGASKKTEMSAHALKKHEKGREMAHAYFIEGLNKKQTIIKLFPNYSPESAKRHAKELFIRYKVVDHYLSLFESTFKNGQFEQTMNHLQHNAILNRNDKMTLEIARDIGRVQGKYKSELEVSVVSPEEKLSRLNKAKALLASSGIDISTLDPSSKQQGQIIDD